MHNTVEIVGGDHLKTLQNCGGYYSCPKDVAGNRLGPLVGYAGKYSLADGSPRQLQFVGDVYANFAMAEVYPNVLKFFANCLLTRLDPIVPLMDVGALCGAPIGGYSLADALGLMGDLKVIKAEKKVTALATETSREKSKLVFARHNVEKGLRYVIVEDVCNNFSTTEELIALIHSVGGIVVAIVCFLNRSPKVEELYYSATMEADIPVISLVRKPIAEWQQDDPAVAEDIAKGNVVLKPKDRWPVLMKAMDDQQ